MTITYAQIEPSYIALWIDCQHTSNLIRNLIEIHEIWERFCLICCASINVSILWNDACQKQYSMTWNSLQPKVSVRHCRSFFLLNTESLKGRIWQMEKSARKIRNMQVCQEQKMKCSAKQCSKPSDNCVDIDYSIWTFFFQTEPGNILQFLALSIFVCFFLQGVILTTSQSFHNALMLSFYLLTA